MHLSVTEIVHDLVRPHVRPGDTALDATAGNGHDTLFLAQCVGPTGRVFAWDIQPLAIERTAALLAKHGVTWVELKLGDHVEIEHPERGFSELPAFDPGGIAEISRWSQTTGMRSEKQSTPEGSQTGFARPCDPSVVGGYGDDNPVVCDHRLISAIPPGSKNTNFMRLIHPPIVAAIFNLGYLPASDRTISTTMATSLRAIAASVARLAPGGILTVLAYTGHVGGREEADAIHNLLRGMSFGDFDLKEVPIPGGRSAPPRLFALVRRLLQ